MVQTGTSGIRGWAGLSFTLGLLAEPVHGGKSLRKIKALARLGEGLA
jgi:hypothetical protein